MNSDPKYATSCRDPPLKNVRNVINLFVDPKMRSTPEVSSTEVMFSVHEDSVWPMLPPRTFSVGFEEKIVVGVMFFTFSDPKIVVKSLFPILYFFFKPIFSRQISHTHTCMHAFTTTSPLFREWSRENMGFVVFWIFSKFLSDPQ